MPPVQPAQRFYAQLPTTELAAHENPVPGTHTTMDDRDQDQSQHADLVPPPVKHPNPVRSYVCRRTRTPSAKSEDTTIKKPATAEDECIEAEDNDDDEWWKDVDWDSDTSSDSSPVSSPGDSNKENECSATDIEMIEDNEQAIFVTDNGECRPFLDLERLEPAKNKDIDFRRYAMINWQVECNDAREIEKEHLQRQLEG
ncbi:hypothetical protein LTR10_022004 [Elasticomyces elasticus]|uniref:Uncharacterized protein n=1 Tax=Exophiala sideris TaxID=1016849 RepID=A0ABR0IYX6_9EURO|nr:hypothetical protein LTR10_022004 [Elasticomyces elasticus]KAK5022916.1 hypothetical protein LTS07_009644 [Exophiala sideris]KAK5026405.1 hypothetical protein LTR13_010019 [Exophiala sideris]KAK5052340.1 hypothetical protein LTR69_009876 [Exophiala sideris]KAK5177367.1 hypothetical protein LTR44_010162 [Eurotiomycetes sp. CCFEE 6388]